MTTGGSFTDYPVPTQNAWPQGITAGPDGAMWFTEVHGDKIGRIDMNGTITEYPLASGSHPWGIAAGPDGNLWFAENGRDTIGQITTGGTITEWKIPNDCNPSYGCNPIRITAGPDGAMWFTDGNPNYQGGYVGRITTGPSSKDRRAHEPAKHKGLTQGLRPPNRFQP
jgi:virginiamycin B lyase